MGRHEAQTVIGNDYYLKLPASMQPHDIGAPIRPLDA